MVWGTECITRTTIGECVASHQSLFAPNLTHISQSEFQMMCTSFLLRPHLILTWIEVSKSFTSTVFPILDSLVSDRMCVSHLDFVFCAVEFECHRLSTHTHRARESHQVARFNFFLSLTTQLLLLLRLAATHKLFLSIITYTLHTYDRNWSILFLFYSYVYRSLTLASLTDKRNLHIELTLRLETHIVFILI